MLFIFVSLSQYLVRKQWYKNFCHYSLIQPPFHMIKLSFTMFVSCYSQDINKYFIMCKGGEYYFNSESLLFPFFFLCVILGLLEVLCYFKHQNLAWNLTAFKKLHTPVMSLYDKTLLHLFLMLEVIWIQNEFMRSSFLPKCTPKITRISVLPYKQGS